MKFRPSWSTKKVVDTFSNFELKNSLYSVSTKIVFQLSQGLIQLFKGLRRNVNSREESESKWNFVPAGLRKK